QDLTPFGPIALLLPRNGLADRVHVLGRADLANRIIHLASVEIRQIGEHLALNVAGRRRGHVPVAAIVARTPVVSVRFVIAPRAPATTAVAATMSPVAHTWHADEETERVGRFRYTEDAHRQKRDSRTHSHKALPSRDHVVSPKPFLHRRCAPLFRGAAMSQLRVISADAGARTDRPSVHE